MVSTIIEHQRLLTSLLSSCEARTGRCQGGRRGGDEGELRGLCRRQAIPRRKAIKGKIGIDRGIGIRWLRLRGWKEATGDVGKWSDIIKKRNGFAYGAADTFETAPALAAGRLTAPGRCEARRRGTFRKWHLTRVVCMCARLCVCVCVSMWVEGASFIFNSPLCSSLQK